MQALNYAAILRHALCNLVEIRFQLADKAEIEEAEFALKADKQLFPKGVGRSCRLISTFKWRRISMMLLIIEASVDGRPIPFASRAFTRLASV